MKDLKGKDAVFHVKLHAITREELPELDDDFVKEASETANTVEEYKAEIREKLEKVMMGIALVMGVAIPIQNGWSNRSVVNIAAQYERVEPKFSGMIAENYFRLCLGITFNEMWFSKWKVR